MVSKQPASVAEAIARRASRRAALALAVALLLTVALTVVAYRSLVRPLRRVLALQRQVVGLGPSAATGDELHDLRSSLETLERRSRDRQELDNVFLGRYRIVEVLGEGAMGTVFRAWDPKLKRGVALKTIRLGQLAPRRQEEFIDRLLHEAVAAARLSHPNVVGVYDVVEHEGAAFLAMELVEGISLQKLLRIRKTLHPEEAAHVGLGVARALAAAHEAGLVHHDVKPGNILLGFNGDIKVTDFGIAQFLNDVSEDPGVIYGTPGYLPPETLRGEGYDELGDVFALGVVLFQTLTGLLPRLTRSLANTVVDGKESEPESLLEYNVSVPEDLDRLIQWLLAAQRSKRVPSAVVAARRLEQLITRHGWKWSPPTGGETVASREVEDEERVEHSRFVRTRVLRSSGGTGRGAGRGSADRGTG
ncbi:MAG TPA: serine/threonine protein kinase [Acidobacteria bacterium]|nr:serine/threonine protein kinase [Acidobacteriota bacterium]